MISLNHDVSFYKAFSHIDIEIDAFLVVCLFVGIIQRRS